MFNVFWEFIEYLTSFITVLFLLIIELSNPLIYGFWLPTLWYPTLCDKVCQWLATGQWFSPGTPFFSTNKTDCHDRTEILLKVALNTINLNLTYNKDSWKACSVSRSTIYTKQKINISLSFRWYCNGTYLFFSYN